MLGDPLLFWPAFITGQWNEVILEAPLPFVAQSFWKNLVTSMFRFLEKRIPVGESDRGTRKWIFNPQHRILNRTLFRWVVDRFCFWLSRVSPSDLHSLVFKCPLSLSLSVSQCGICETGHGHPFSIRRSGLFSVCLIMTIHYSFGRWPISSTAKST